MKIVIVFWVGVCDTLLVMKTYLLTINYKAKIQVLLGANADEILENPVINGLDPEVLVIDSEVDEGTVNVVPDSPDFFNVDIRMKVTIECEECEEDKLQDIVEGGLEFDMNNLFAVWDWEVYGWGVESVK